MMSITLVIVFAFLSASRLTAAQELSSNNESISFPLRPALATQQLQAVSDSSETCSLPEAHTAVEEAFHQVLQEDVLDKLTCNDTDSASLGIFQYCPAANCSQVFSVSQMFHFPGYYWITAENGSVIKVHCGFESEKFSYASAEIDNMADNTCPTSERREYVQEKSKANIQPQLSRMSPSLLPCTAQITGLVAHCPANSCSQLFDLIHEGFLRLSKYYWLRSPDGSVAEVYCNRSTRQAEYSSCQQVFQFETMSSGTYILRISDGDVTEVYCNRSTRQAEYSSCQQVFQFETMSSGTYILRISDGVYSDVYCNNETGLGEYRSCAHANLFGLPSGTYTIRPSAGSPVTVYCDMDNEECGGGGWMRVASYNYSDPNTVCPGDWNLITSPNRSCGRSSPSASCASAVFPTNSIEFSSVCGRVITIQYGSPNAFYPYHDQNQRSIDDYYVDGVSITYGNPRQHVWTFAAYRSDDNTYLINLCPCSQPSLNVPSPPPFVGNNYFCDTAAPTCCSAIYYPDDPLWDGQGCGGPSTCCSFNNPPWFSTALPETTSDDIEVRICDNQRSSIDDTPITNLDLYIQ